MSKIGNIAFAGGTVAVALVTGFLMQAGSSGQEPAQRYAALESTTTIDGSVAPAAKQDDAPVSVAANVILAGVSAPSEPMAKKTVAPMGMASLDLSEAVTEKILPKPSIVDVATEPVDVVGRFALAPLEYTETAPQPVTQVESCDVSLSAEPTAAAMVQLDLIAPCHPKERVTVHHNGMMFTEVTDEDGSLSTKVAALSENAVFMVSLATGKTVVSQAKVTSLEFYDRAVVQWKGDVSLQIHAREFGADYGEDGHIWSEQAGSVQEMISGQSGFISRFGDGSSPDALIAEVYTFPTLTSKQQGEVLLSVEAEVIDNNCGQNIEAQSIQFSSGKSLRVQDLLLQMPACDSFGGYLVLKNLLEDLTIAHK